MIFVTISILFSSSWDLAHILECDLEG